MIPEELMQFARQLSPMFSTAAAAMAQQERTIAESVRQVLGLADAIARPEVNWRELERITRRFTGRRVYSRRESARRADHNRQRAANLVKGADWAPTWWWAPPHPLRAKTLAGMKRAADECFASPRQVFTVGPDGTEYWPQEDGTVTMMFSHPMPRPILGGGYA